MTSRTLQSLRLDFKRAFCAYFLALNDPGRIADPTDAFATASLYLAALRESLGQEEFGRRLEEDVTALAGHCEQDLRQFCRSRGLEADLSGLEKRLRECVEHGLSHLGSAGTGVSG